MAKSDAQKAKGGKEALMEFLDNNPPIYRDVAKWVFYCMFGVKLKSVFPNFDSEVVKESFLEDLQKDGSYSVVNDPEGGSELFVKVTEKGLGELIDLFYSGKEKRQLKRILTKMGYIHLEG